MNKFTLPDVTEALEGEATAQERGKMTRIAVLGTLLAVSLIANAVQLVIKYNARLSRPLVTAGGEPITKYAYQSALEQRDGKIILNKLVLAALVRQAAAREHVTPTDADVDARVAALKSSNSQAIPTDKVALKAFREDLRTDMALENLRLKGVTASDAEVAAFFNRNKAAFTQPPQAQFTLVTSEHSADAQSAAALLQQGVSPEKIAARPRLHVVGVNGFNVNMPPQLAQAFKNTVFAMKPGQVKTMTVGSNYLTVKLKGLAPAVVPTLDQARAVATRQLKLLKAPSAQAELATLYQQNPPTFNVQNYAAFFSDIRNYDPQTDVAKKTASAQ
ncbi:MAG: peptidyl-prolyl cis-trans isomerase [Armatimonadota bacterium]|nr:peptidyl-prolyl cis-trans isomerase [Armatimonadota bacterium]